MGKEDAIFVPTLNADITREEGLKTALSFGRMVKYEFGIFDGKLGVLFTVLKTRKD
jgi:hypothetical protein